MDESDAKVLHTSENEYGTDEIIRIGDDYFLRTFRLRAGKPDDVRVEALDRYEARRLLLEEGLDPQTVGKLTGAGEDEQKGQDA